MNTRALTFAVFGLIAVGLAALLWWTGDSPPPPAPAGGGLEAGRSGAGEVRQAAGTVPQDATPAVDRPAERQEVETAAARALGPDEAIVRGRCVDEEGAPIAGVTVDLHGWTGNSERMQRFELAGGEVDWEDPEDVVTGVDGRFEFRVTPPPPYQFTVDMQAEDRVEMRFRWSELPAGEVRDVGDVLLPLGVEVTGRVVDEDDVGVANARVQARPESRRRRGAAFPASYQYVSADAGGYFRYAALPVGPVEFGVLRREVREPEGAVTLARPRHELRIVAVAPAADTRPAIRGVVVDAAGAPVQGARIHAGEPDVFRMMNGAGSGSDGSFQVRQEATSTRDPVPLTVAARGHVEWRSPEPVAWGTDGLRVVLQSGPPLSVRATAAPDDRPVERFGITLAPIRENGGWSSVDDELLHLGDHPGGLLRVDHVTPGRYRLAVHPPESTGLDASARREIEVVAGRPSDHDVRLWPIVAREVRVVTADGEPVAGVPVELLAHQAGGDLTLTMTAMERRNARINSPEHVAELVDSGRTDGAGRLSLTGTAGRDLALRLPGPGNVPLLVQPVRTDADQPLRVVVQLGATLRGHVGPPEILEQLRREGYGDARDDDDARVGVALSRSDGDPRGFPVGRLGGATVPLTDDGRFELRGVPAGTWSLQLRWPRVHRGAGGLGSGASSISRDVAEGITLADGEARDVAVDVTALRQYEVEIRARVDGAPRELTVSLWGEVGTRPDGGPRNENAQAVVADDGRGVAHLVAGSWKATLQIAVDGITVQVPGPELRVPEGAAAGIDLDVRLGRRAVRIERPDGSPAHGIQFQATPSPTGAARVPAGRATDAGGRTTLHGTVGTYPLVVRREPLDDWAEVRAWQEQNPGVDFGRAFLQVGQIELVPGDREEVVLRLPQEWAELPK